MLELYHLNCVKIVSPINDNVCGHCLLLKTNDKLILIDTGIGLADTLDPIGRIGKELIDMVGYRFDENQTAYRQIKTLGFDPGNVTDCIISHLDNDHIGGLADFPTAKVHISIEEFENYINENPRYLKMPLSHNPEIKTYGKTDATWFGLEARIINVNIDTEIFFIPLFGHTTGHCGVAFNLNNNWYFYIGDAYYMKIELKNSNHPVNKLAEIRADDNTERLVTLDKLRELANDHPEINIFSYHDISEFYLFEPHTNN